MPDYNALVSQLEQYFASGCKKDNQTGIGLEAEHFAVDKKTLKSVKYEGSDGVHGLLIRLSPYFSEQYCEADNLLGLSNKDVSITLEPGGQIELSIEHSRDIADTAKIYLHYHKIIEDILNMQGRTLISQGYLPASCVKDIPLIPKERYRFMDAYFRNTGKTGMNMMRGTASCQVSVDYISESDFIDKYRCAYVLSPILALMSGNTPVYEGKRNKNPLIRTKIWRGVDPERTGIIPQVFERDFSFRKYAEYILSQNAIFERKGDIMCASGRKVFEVLGSADADFDDMLLYISLVFPDVRLRQYIEIRIADSMPVDKTLAYMALIKGLFADTAGLKNRLEELSQDKNGIIKAQDAIMKRGELATVYGQPVSCLIAEFIGRALINLDDTEGEILRKGFTGYEY